VTDQVHQVSGIFVVMDGELGIEADLAGVFAQQARADAVEGSGLGQRIRHDTRAVAHHLTCDAIDAPRHLGRRAAGECHQQDTPWIGAAHDQMRDAVGEGVGLAGSRAGYDQQWRARTKPCAMLDGATLFRIQMV
jgi:hypothetical protein